MGLYDNYMDVLKKKKVKKQTEAISHLGDETEYSFLIAQKKIKYQQFSLNRVSTVRLNHD